MAQLNDSTENLLINLLAPGWAVSVELTGEVQASEQAFDLTITVTIGIGMNRVAYELGRLGKTIASAFDAPGVGTAWMMVT